MDHRGAAQPGKLPLLIVQGVLMTAARAGRRHRAAGRGVGREGRRLRERPGPAAGGVARDHAAGRGAGGLADVRQRRPGARRGARRTRAAPPSAAISPRRWPATSATPASRQLAFARPVSAKHWLQASNPSERWKWDFMFQDLPPVKFAGKPAPTSWFNGLPVTHGNRVNTATSEPARQHV